MKGVFMKHSIRKLFSVFLVFILVVQLSSTVCAATSNDQAEGIPADQVEEEDTSITQRSVFFPVQFENDGVSLTLKHTLTANGVQRLLINSAKTITKQNLPSDAKKIYVVGELTHSGFSRGTTQIIRTGLCYLNYDNGLYIADHFEYVPSATSFTEIICSVSSLNSDVTYYPFITNLATENGTVSGSVGFYYSTS